MPDVFEYAGDKPPGLDVLSKHSTVLWKSPQGWVRVQKNGSFQPVSGAEVQRLKGAAPPQARPMGEVAGMETMNTERPWDSPALQLPRAAPSAPPVSSTPYSYSAPDPYAHAQQLAERQGTVAKMAGPMAPVVEVPTDIFSELVKKVKGLWPSADDQAAGLRE